MDEQGIILTDDQILNKLKMVIYCLMSHPDNQVNSEFANRIDDLIDINDEIKQREKY